MYVNRRRIEKGEKQLLHLEDRLKKIEEFQENKLTLKNREEYITNEQIEVLKQRVKRKGKPSSIWCKFRLHFDITRYIFLPRNRFREALDWLENYKCEKSGL